MGCRDVLLDSMMSVRLQVWRMFHTKRQHHLLWYLHEPFSLLCKWTFSGWLILMVILAALSPVVCTVYCDGWLLTDRTLNSVVTRYTRAARTRTDNRTGFHDHVTNWLHAGAIWISIKQRYVLGYLTAFSYNYIFIICMATCTIIVDVTTNHMHNCTFVYLIWIRFNNTWCEQLIVRWLKEHYNFAK
jgi:hypothetical protein